MTGGKTASQKDKDHLLWREQLLTGEDAHLAFPCTATQHGDATHQGLCKYSLHVTN